VIGAVTMGVRAALMEELALDKRLGFFVNHDLAGYEVPVHADIPHQDVIFLDETDPISSPMKAKGVGELGICGIAAAVANAVYNATGIRVRDYPITLDKLLDRLPPVVSTLRQTGHTACPALFRDYAGIQGQGRWQRQQQCHSSTDFNGLGRRSEVNLHDSVYE
jgi:Molybdopterin-binding domain of aldehyde dehydrogenase